MLCARVGAELRVIPLNPDGRCNWRRYLRCLMRKLACWQFSCLQRAGNGKSAGGNDHACDQHGTKVLVDGAQAVMHHPVTFRRWIAIFTRSPGINCMAPWDWHSLCQRSLVAGDAAVGRGGSMIATVSLSEGTTWTKALGGLKPVHPIPGASLVLARRGVCVGAGA